MASDDLSSFKKTIKVTDEKLSDLKLDQQPGSTLHATTSNMAVESNVLIDSQFTTFENFYSTNDLNINLEHNDDDFISSSLNIQNNNTTTNNKLDDDEDNALIPSDIIEYNVDITDFLNNNSSMDRMADFGGEFLDSKAKKNLNNNNLNYLLDLNSLNFKSRKHTESNIGATVMQKSNENRPINIGFNQYSNNSSKQKDDTKFNINLASMNFKNNDAGSSAAAFDNILASDFNFCFEQSSFNNRFLLNEISKINFDKYFEQLLLSYINIDVTKKEIPF
jgi:hypothetical protein